jgi:acetoin utilization deacetylase AcuC-like enzyme
LILSFYQKKIVMLSDNSTIVGHIDVDPVEVVAEPNSSSSDIVAESTEVVSNDQIVSSSDDNFIQNDSVNANHGELPGNSVDNNGLNVVASLHQQRAISIVYHDDCEFHCIANHPEQPGRYKYILSTLRGYYDKDGSNSAGIFVEAPFVTEEQALRFHTRDHWNALMQKCDEAEHQYTAAVTSINDDISRSQSKQTTPVKAASLPSSATSSPFPTLLSPISALSKKHKNLLRESIVRYDSDTQIMHGSRNAILRAAGSVCMAVDMVCSSPATSRSVFCCVRPPGHHAEMNTAMGFCFLANAGIAAKHAQAVYGIERVAVLDFDVHHGYV